MSFQDVSDALRYSQAQGLDKLVLICIANYTDQDHQAWPSVTTLVSDSGTSESTVRRSIQNLIGIGELAKIKEGGIFDNKHVSNTYRVSIRTPVGVCQTGSGCLIDRDMGVTQTPDPIIRTNHITKKKLSLDDCFAMPKSDLLFGCDSQFLQYWKFWVENRWQHKQGPPTLGALEEHLKICKSLGTKRAVDAIRHSVATGKMSIYERPTFDSGHSPRKLNCLGR